MPVLDYPDQIYLVSATCENPIEPALLAESLDKVFVFLQADAAAKARPYFDEISTLKAEGKATQKDVQAQLTAAKDATGVGFERIFKLLIKQLEISDPSLASFLAESSNEEMLEDLLATELARRAKISIRELQQEKDYDFSGLVAFASGMANSIPHHPDAFVFQYLYDWAGNNKLKKRHGDHTLNAIFDAIQQEVAEAHGAMKKANYGTKSGEVIDRSKVLLPEPSGLEIFSSDVDAHGHALFLSILGELQDIGTQTQNEPTFPVDLRNRQELRQNYVEAAKKHPAFRGYFSADGSSDSATDPRKYTNRLEHAFVRRLEFFELAEGVVGFAFAENLSGSADDKAGEVLEEFEKNLFQAFERIFPKISERHWDSHESGINILIDFALHKLTQPATNIHGFSLADYFKAAESARVRAQHHNSSAEQIRSAFTDYVKKALWREILQKKCQSQAKQHVIRQPKAASGDASFSPPARTDVRPAVSGQTHFAPKKIPPKSRKAGWGDKIRRFAAAGVALGAGLLAGANTFLSPVEPSAESDQFQDDASALISFQDSETDNAETPKNNPKPEQKLPSRYVVDRESEALAKYFHQLGRAEDIKQAIDALVENVSVPLPTNDCPNVFSLEIQIKLYEAIVNDSKYLGTGSHSFFQTLRDTKAEFVGLLGSGKSLAELQRLGRFEPQIRLLEALEVKISSANSLGQPKEFALDWTKVSSSGALQGLPKPLIAVLEQAAETTTFEANTPGANYMKLLSTAIELAPSGENNISLSMLRRCDATFPSTSPENWIGKILASENYKVKGAQYGNLAPGFQNREMGTLPESLRYTSITPVQTSSSTSNTAIDEETRTTAMVNEKEGEIALTEDAFDEIILEDGTVWLHSDNLVEGHEDTAEAEIATTEIIELGLEHLVDDVEEDPEIIVAEGEIDVDLEELEMDPTSVTGITNRRVRETVRVAA